VMTERAATFTATDPTSLPNDVSTADAVVVGAGPAGCATAIRLASGGRRVLLLEPNPVQQRRFAGEWIHPPGVRQLEELGIDMTAFPHVRGNGFAVYVEDDSQPVLLPYPKGEQSVSFEHAALVAALRARVRDFPNIVFALGARLLEVDDSGVWYRHSDSDRKVRVCSGLVVGADGRGSAVRKKLGESGTSSTVSHMAGVLVDTDLQLTAEGFAHVLIGAPGPVLMYRVAPRKIRVCFDVPHSLLPACRSVDGLWELYGDVIPVELRRTVRSALETSRLQWATNRLQHRELFGQNSVALVGDAVGHTHPLSACGLTMALLDAECLGRTWDVAAYAHERRAQSVVPELVAHTIYRVSAEHDPGSITLRHGLSRLWRNSPALSSRTMQLLTTDETNFGAFCRIFLRGVGAALVELMASAKRRGVRSTALSVVGLAGWIAWLTRSLRRRPSSRLRQPTGSHAVPQLAE
jgi:squalene monooxygenase